MTNFSDVINNTVSFSEFNRGQAGKIFKNVKQTRAKLVMKNNVPECVLISPEDYKQIVDDYNDLLLLLDAIERISNADPKEMYTQEEAVKMFGLTRERLEDDEVFQTAKKRIISIDKKPLP
ncbi:MAG: hypothetical protein IJI46_07070 [Erysipelotrichaceae bacterium]|nr:hypothetical protein [Erysipelotrichaceae bacterium]